MWMLNGVKMGILTIKNPVSLQGLRYQEQA